MHGVQVPCSSRHALSYLSQCLSHRFPTVRMHTSEQLFLLVQELSVSHNTSELETQLLTASWYVFSQDHGRWCKGRQSICMSFRVGPSRVTHSQPQPQWQTHQYISTFMRICSSLFLSLYVFSSSPVSALRHERIDTNNTGPWHHQWILLRYQTALYMVSKTSWHSTRATHSITIPLCSSFCAVCKFVTAPL